MSEYGKSIVEKLHKNSVLRDPNHPMRKIIDYTVGAWLDEYSVTDLFENMFLESATGKWLDLHGKQYGVTRQLDESDEDYRKRITYESLNRLTLDYLVNMFDVEVYTAQADLTDLEKNILVSDNPYISDNGFMCVASSEVKEAVNRKFVLDEEITWVTL